MTGSPCVFFSFDRSRDTARADQVRAAWAADFGGSGVGSWDVYHSPGVEQLPQSERDRLIDLVLTSATVTLVLIGADTHQSVQVWHEVRRSLTAGKGLLGVYVDGIADRSGATDSRGDNPFWAYRLQSWFRPIWAARVDVDPPVFDWIADDGGRNLGEWVRQAAAEARS